MRRIALAVCLMAALGACTSTAIVYTSHAGFTPWSVTPLSVPQVAVGDFDGDGHPDTARIATRNLSRRDVSIVLSGAEGDVFELEGAVSALVEGDIDHDGDLDLLATTPSGGVLVWLNDGHGRFTRQSSSPRRSLSGESAVGSTRSNTVVTALPSAPALPSRVGAHRATIAQASRPPAVLAPPNRARLLLPPLRAPPLSL